LFLALASRWRLFFFLAFPAPQFSTGEAKKNKTNYFFDISESFDIKVRDKNKRTNLGKIYLDKI